MVYYNSGPFVLKGGSYFFKVDLSLKDSGPFFVRVVLSNLLNPPGYGPNTYFLEIAFVCVCMCLCVCIQVHVCRHIFVCVYTCMCMCVCPVCMCMHVNKYMYVCAFTYVHVFMHICVCVPLCMSVALCMCICMYTCVCMCVPSPILLAKQVMITCKRRSNTSCSFHKGLQL